MSPRCSEGTGQERNALVPQFEQVLGNSVAGEEVISLYIDELTAKRGGMAKQDSGDAPGKQLLVNGRLSGQTIDGRDE